MVLRFNLAALIFWMVPLLGQPLPQIIVSAKRNKHITIPILTEGLITIGSVDQCNEKNNSFVLHEPYLMINVTRNKVTINNHKVVSGAYQINIEEPMVSIYNK